MSQATGISRGFDLGEAIRNAVENLPPAPHPDFGFTVTVTKIRGDFTRGIVPPHLGVTVERPNGPTAVAQGQKPNAFTLQGKNKRIRYEATSISGRPLFGYQDEKDESRSGNFNGDEIDIREMQFGTFVTVMIKQVPDSHVVWLTLVVPTIYLPDGNKEFPIKTIAIFTTHQTPFVGPGGVNGLQVDTYDTLALEGTARLAIS